MAEYNDVIRHFKRMCRYYNNRATQNDCPLYCKGHGCNISHCRMLAFDDKKFQNVVMTWAEAHKEPVYPTWYEWLTSIGAVTRKVKPDVASTLIETGLLDHIPADMAQKLGLQPKEV